MSLETTERMKKQILAFLPAMIELEKIGLNPIKASFDNTNGLSIEVIESMYVSFNRAKSKYPEWHNAIKPYISEITRALSNQSPLQA